MSREVFWRSQQGSSSGHWAAGQTLPSPWNTLLHGWVLIQQKPADTLLPKMTWCSWQQQSVHVPFFTLSYRFTASWKTPNEGLLRSKVLVWSGYAGLMSSLSKASRCHCLLILFFLSEVIHLSQKLSFISRDKFSWARNEGNWLICHFSYFQRIPACLGSLSSHRLLCRLPAHMTVLKLSLLDYHSVPPCFWSSLLWVTQGCVSWWGAVPFHEAAAKDEHFKRQTALMICKYCTDLLSKGSCKINGLCVAALSLPREITMRSKQLRLRGVCVCVFKSFLVR